VIQGSDFFNVEQRREKFGPGDVLFAPAHVSHEFEDFGQNLMVWVLFYGPEGGERGN